MPEENRYEAMFIVSAGKTKEDWDKCMGNLRGILQRHKATIQQMEKWSDRKLAYPIRGHQSGVYILANFSAPPSAIQEIKRDCQLAEDVLRVLILKEEKKASKAVVKKEAGDGKPQ
ncbi:MAG: 30S ribosomal protein S6 [Planctomycetota bacterium]